MHIEILKSRVTEERKKVQMMHIQPLQISLYLLTNGSQSSNKSENGFREDCKYYQQYLILQM